MDVSQHFVIKTKIFLPRGSTETIVSSYNAETEKSTGGLATSDVPLRSEISVSNRSIICFCSSATCWSHEIICEWPSGWRCGKRLRGVERNEHGLRVCAGDRSGDSTGGSGERTGGRGDSGVHDNGEMVLWVIEVLVVAVALVMVSILSGTFVVLVDVLA